MKFSCHRDGAQEISFEVIMGSHHAAGAVARASSARKGYSSHNRQEESAHARAPLMNKTQTEHLSRLPL